jgi:hypothetical protein
MGTIKILLGFLFAIAVAVSLFQIAPPMLANFSFQDDLRTVVLMDSANLQKTDDDIRIDVLKKAKEHELPIGEKQITVQRINTPGISAVYVAADYSVPVSLPGYTFDMHFTPNSGNRTY